MQFADIILPLALPNPLTYAVPADFLPVYKGMRVAVPLGKNKIYTGIIYKLHNITPSYSVKNILYIIDSMPIVTESQIKLWEWISEYYMCTLGEVMKAALPSTLKIKSQTRVSVCSPQNFDNSLTLTQNTILNNLRNRQFMLLNDLKKLLQNNNFFEDITLLKSKNLISVEEYIQDNYRKQTEILVALSLEYNSEKSINHLFSLCKRSKQQEKLLLAYFSMINPTDYSKYQFVKRKELLDKAEVKHTVLKTLINKNIFIERETEKKEELSVNVEHNILPELSVYQQEAFDKITKYIEKKKVTLLHGVTSSGKTEIYIHLIQNTIRQNRQVLFLVPEIALTTQLIQRLTKIFGSLISVYHSKFNDNQRANVYYSLLNNRTQIVLGVRSSVFLPFFHLGLIIIDEEHETTYKQYEPSPRYNARDTAIMLANQTGADILLGSATPAIESYFNAKSGKYGYVPLTHRYNDVPLPKIQMVNTSSLRQSGSNSFFSPFLLGEIKKSLEQNEQIILFQNRRGFSPYIECCDCGWIPRCKYCNVSLVYHKSTGSMVCHYCGYIESIPSFCPDCHSTNLISKGFGTEKIEEELRLIFQNIVIERMDLDVAQCRSSYQRILSDFEKGKIQILIGTQMITKGLDFDNVGLVGVIDADSMLSFPDFRSAERSFQLIQQVAGRAGRRSKQGLVLVQTRAPLHPILQQLRSNDYDGMYLSQLDERNKFSYPPFSRLIKIILKCQDKGVLYDAAATLAQLLRSQFNNCVLGPQTPLIDKIQDLYLINFLLKIPRSRNLHASKLMLQQQLSIVRKHPAYRRVIIIIDVDA